MNTKPTEVPRSATPLAGPLHEAPQVSAQLAGAMFDEALTGLPLGAYDLRIIREMDGGDPSAIAAVASLLRRSWAAGLVVGRREVADEQWSVTAMLALHRRRGQECACGERLGDAGLFASPVCITADGPVPAVTVHEAHLAQVITAALGGAR